MVQARGFLSKTKLVFEDTFNTTPLQEDDSVVDDITDQGGDTFRYEVPDTADMTSQTGRTVIVANSTNAANDGRFVVTGSDNTPAGKYFEVTNASGVAEAVSPATYDLNPQFESMPYNDNSVGSDENLIDPDTVTGNRYDVEPARGNISVQGGITAPVDVRSMGTWLKLFFGAPSTSGAGPYVHVYTPTDDTPSVTMENSFPDIDVHMLFNGCKINTWTSRFVTNEELTTDIDMLGGTETVISDAVSSDDNPVTRVFKRFNAKDIVLAIDTVDSTIVKELTVEMTNELADDQYTLTSNGFRSSLPESGLSISGTMTVFFENATLYNKAVNSTELRLTATATNGADILVFDMQEVILPRQAPVRSGTGPIDLELPYRAYFQDGGFGVPIKVTLTNDVSSYA